MPGDPFYVELARKLCEEFGWNKCHFAVAVGKRRHFVGGWGTDNFTPSFEVELSPGLFLYYQGREVDSGRIGKFFEHIQKVHRTERLTSLEFRKLTEVNDADRS